MNLRLSLAGTAALLKGHPWIAAGAQLSYRVIPPAGELLKVQDAQADFLGWALSEGPGREPAFRLLSRERQPGFGIAWWAAAVERALGLRRAAGLEPSAGAPLRLLQGEADGLPGLFCDAAGGLGLLSVESPAVVQFLPALEAALLKQAGLRGLWRRLAEAPGSWGPWHPSPLAPASPGRAELGEGALRARLDLEAGQALPWPVERRSWRAWAAEACAGRKALALGALAGEAAAAEAGGAARLQRIEKGFLKSLKPAFKPERILLELPAASRESFGRFDALAQGPRFLASLAQAAPGALALLASAHPGLQAASAWEQAFRQAGLEASLEKVLGPGPDLPEPAAFPEGRARRAFVFQLPQPA